jgi:hypothetical protein
VNHWCESAISIDYFASGCSHALERNQWARHFHPSHLASSIDRAGMPCVLANGHPRSLAPPAEQGIELSAADRDRAPVRQWLCPPAASRAATRSRSAARYASTSRSISRMRGRTLCARRTSSRSRERSLNNVCAMGSIHPKSARYSRSIRPSRATVSIGPAKRPPIGRSSATSAPQMPGPKWARVRHASAPAFKTAVVIGYARPPGMCGSSHSDAFIAAARGRRADARRGARE